MSLEFSDLTWSKYPLTALILLVFFAAAGLGPMAAARNALPAWRWLLAPQIGMAWIILIVAWYARLGTALHAWMLLLLAAASLAGCALVIRRAGLAASLRTRVTDRHALTSDAASLAGPWLVGIGLATLFILPMITSRFVAPGFMTTFTLGNNDIGSYVGEAANVLRAGFDNAGLYYDWNPGSSPSTLSADADHTGAATLLASAASVLGYDVWKIAQSVMMLALAGLFASATALSRALMPRWTHGAMLIGGLGAASAFVLYIAGSLFIAHIICMCLMVAQLAIAYEARDRLLTFRTISLLAPLGAATWLTSPEMQLITLVLIAILLYAHLIAETAVMRAAPIEQALTRAGGLAIATALAIVLVLPFFTDAVDRSKRVYDNSGSVGWNLDLHNGVSFLLGFPDPIGSAPNAGGTLTAIAFAIALLACFAIALRRRDAVGITIGLTLCAIATIIVWGAIRFGWTDYQSWKLLTTLSVIFLPLAGVLALRALRGEGQRIMLGAFACVIALNIVRGADFWTGPRSSAAQIENHTVGKRLATFLESERVQRQRQLNIYLPQMFATMIAPVIYDERAAMSSPTYYTAGQPGPHPYRCSMMPETTYDSKLGRVVWRSHGYVLVATPRCL